MSSRVSKVVYAYIYDEYDKISCTVYTYEDSNFVIYENCYYMKFNNK